MITILLPGRHEILLRLPPKPSSLPCASLVCTRWRNILSDLEFLKRYRKHHHTPPLLGFFVACHMFVPFPFMKPDRISATRFSFPKRSYPHWKFLGCRHGLTILINNRRREVVVWDPLTGQQHRVPFPPGLHNAETNTFQTWHAAVMCIDAEDGHVHGDCFSSAFKIVLTCCGDTQAHACVYESAYGEWGHVASTTTKDSIFPLRSSVLIGNAVCWLLCGGGVLLYDIERKSLDVIEKPVNAHFTDCYSFQILRTNDSGLGFAVMSKLGIRLWKRRSFNSSGVVGWVLQPKVIQLEWIFPHGISSSQKQVLMVGYDEDSNSIVLATYFGEFMLQIESTWFRKISEKNCWGMNMRYPYRNFYTTGKGVGWKPAGQKL